MRKILTLALFVLSFVSLSAQKTIVDPNAELMEVKNFTSIKVSGGFDVYISYGDEAVAVSASSNEHLDKIKTEVENGVLKIWFESKGLNFYWGPGNYNSLRNYLEIVFAYAGTISLAKELESTNVFKVGTIIITPGSPGHCSIIVDEGINEKGEKLFKLAEGYTPAQSICILKNPEDDSEWYRIKKGSTIETSSYRFRNYKLGVFE